MNTSTAGQHMHTQPHTHIYTAPVSLQQFTQQTGGVVCLLRHETETERGRDPVEAV